MMTPEEMKSTGKGVEHLITARPKPEQQPYGSSCRWPVPNNYLTLPDEKEDSADEGVDYKADFLAAMRQLDACYALLEILDDHGADNLLPAMLEADYQEVLVEARKFMDIYLKK